MSKPQIFISYCWEDVEIVDRIDNFFKDIGLFLIKDTRDIGYKDNLIKHMRRVRDTDFVIMVISDAFLKSSNCMYEVVEFLNSPKFEKRILPIRLPGATFFNVTGQVKYYQFWEDQINETENILRGLNDLSKTESIQRELNRFNDIRANLSRFFEYLKDILVKSFDELEEEKYSSLLKEIGINASEFVKLLKSKSSEDTVISEEIQSKKQKEKSDEDDEIQKRKLQEQAERDDIENENKEDQNVSFTDVSNSKNETTQYVHLLSKVNYEDWNSKTITLLEAIKGIELQEIIHSVEELRTSHGSDKNVVLIVNNFDEDFDQDDLKDFFKDSNFLFMIYFGKPNKWKGKKYVPGYQATAFWDTIFITEDINNLESILEKQSIKIIEDGI